MTEFVPGEIYIDSEGKLWRVKVFLAEPSVTLEEVEPSGHTSDPPMVDLAAQMNVANRIGLARGSFIRKTLSRAVSSPLIRNLQRLWRPAAED